MSQEQYTVEGDSKGHTIHREKMFVALMNVTTGTTSCQVKVIHTGITENHAHFPGIIHKNYQDKQYQCQVFMNRCF